MIGVVGVQGIEQREAAVPRIHCVPSGLAGEKLGAVVLEPKQGDVVIGGMGTQTLDLSGADSLVLPIVEIGSPTSVLHVIDIKAPVVANIELVRIERID